MLVPVITFIFLSNLRQQPKNKPLHITQSPNVELIVLLEKRTYQKTQTKYYRMSQVSIRLSCRDRRPKQEPSGIGALLEGKKQLLLSLFLVDATTQNRVERRFQYISKQIRMRPDYLPDSYARILFFLRIFTL